MRRAAASRVMRGVACAKGKPSFAQLDRQHFGGLVQRAAVEYRARTRRRQAAKLFAVHPRHVADDADVAEMIERALVDRKGQRKAVQRRIVFGVGRGHAGVGIALAAVVQPQRLAVGGDPVGVVLVAAGQKAQHIGGGRLDHGSELPLAEDRVAHEIDLPHRGLLPSVTS